MIYTLLGTLCDDVLSASPTLLSMKAGFLASSDTKPLLIHTGNGAFIKTIPDLKILLDKDAHSMTILDYEVSEYVSLSNNDHLRTDITESC
jgi:hypothetical protein